MAETKQEEHARLQKRTDELKQDHGDLGLEKVPFNQADHDQHSADLDDHQRDLAAHKRRTDEN